MYNRFLIAALLLLGSAAQAQQKETIELQPGVTTLEALQGTVYLYPQFQNGVVTFKNGRTGKSKFNYSLLTNEMLFIPAQNDTLALSNETEVKLVTIGTDTFYFNGQHFVKQVKDYGWFKTANLKSIKEKGRKKIGGYGETVEGATINLTSINISKLFFDLSSSEKIILSKETKYFIGNEQTGFVPLNKTNLLKLIPADKQDAANSYAKTHNVDFTIPEQVDQLIAAVKAPGNN